MNPKELIRSATQVHGCLEELPDGRVIAKKQVKIYSPYRYLEKNLVTIGQDTWILGIFSIVVEDKYYAISLLNTMVPIGPSYTNRIKVDGEEYFEFVFNPGDSVFVSTTLVKSDAIVYKIYDEILAKGNVPMLMSYDDLGKLFESASEFAGANIGKNAETNQLIASIITRDPIDRTKYYRQTVKTVEDLDKVKPAFVPLKSVTYAASSTLNRMAGSYFQVGVISSLVNPSQRTEKIEAILRK